MTREDVIHYLRCAPWKTARFGANVRFFRGDTLVRYIDVPFFEGMEDAVGWLCSDEGCAEVFVDGKRPKVRWKPLRAWYEDSGGPGGRSWRLYHAVRNAEDADAGGPYAVENGCVYKEEHTFFWRVAEVMEAPEGGSGVAYSIQGIRRDGESGLFSYVLVRRERVQVDVGPWLSHQETGETRESALLLGVREEEGSGVDDKIADFAQRHGMRVDDGDGTVVDIQKSKNDDCTTDVTLVNTSEEPVDAAAEDYLPVLGVEAAVGEVFLRPFGAEDGANGGLRRAGADELPAHPAAEHGLERVYDYALARAGLAGEDVEARPRLYVRALYDRDVLYVQLPEHDITLK